MIDASSMAFENDDAVAFDPFASGQIEQIVPSTEAQREVWLGDQLSAEASLAYNESMVFRLRGALQVQALSLALDQLVQRHQSLRATFSADGTQLVIGEAAPLALVQHDLSSGDVSSRQQALAAAHAAAMHQPFPLSQGPLLRAALYKLGAAEHELVMTAHHAICDGWSWGVIAEELPQLYAEQTGEGPALDPATGYADYAAWEAVEAASPAMQGHVDYWLGRFGGGNLPVLELPLDRPRPAVRTFKSRRVDHLLDPALLGELRRVGAGTGVSLFATLFSGFGALLHRLTGQDDLVVGIAAAGQLASDMPKLVGHCVNTLSLRLAVDPKMPFDAFARASSSVLMDAFEHQTLTYGSLLTKLAVRRDPSRLPLVSVLFNVDGDATPSAGFPGLEVEQRSIPRAFENFELFVNLTPAAGGMRIEAQYNTDLFDEAAIVHWLSIYETLLRSLAQDPKQALAQINLVSPVEAQALAEMQPEPTALPVPALMHTGFTAMAALQPERRAIRHGARTMSYRELDEQSNKLAHALRARGVGHGQLVGLCIERGFDMLIGLIGILKAGAAYVPLDPTFPKARLDYYAEDARLSLLLTSALLSGAPRSWCVDAAQRVFEIDAESEWKSGSAEALAPSALDAQEEDPAYVIYTSGSTGKPKGVVVPHRAVSNLIQSMQRAPGIGPRDRLAAVTTLSFDIAVAELMLPLTAGAEIIMVPREVSMDGNQLRALLETEKVSVLQATPGMWRLLLDAQWTGGPQICGWIGGESVPADLALALLDNCAEVWNVYGPTETTVWSTVWKMDRDQIRQSGVSIGQPIDNTGIWILDSALQACPVGVPGEICISGTGVTLGYFDRPELTAEKFVTTLIDGQETLIYRTGDKGRWRNDGLLEHMGRFDFQVKVRGYRIELGEIESRANEAPGVARSVVITREDRPGDVRLVAYLALTPGATFDAAAFDRHLRAHLPQYMLPQHVVTLDALPQLPNGKIDRKSLPAPQAAAVDSAERVLPRNPREQTVLQAMEQVLNLPGLGIRDDFFALGGHSLLAARLTTQLGRTFGITVPLRTLFEAPTTEQLAVVIAEMLDAGATTTQIPHQPGRTSAPLTPMQERIRFLEELHPGRSVYNEPSAHRFTGPLNAVKFAAALKEIIRRQPAMRTSIGVDPATREAVQRIEPSIAFDLPIIDLQSVPADQREAELGERMQTLADQPIDIHRAPLFHAALFRMAPDDHAFVFVPHHLVWDGWSFDLLQSELATIYSALVKGEPHGLPELSVDAGDFAAWYSNWLKQPEFEEQLRYWKARFANAPTPSALKTDMPRKAGMSGQGGTQWISVDKTLADRLRQVALEHGVTLNMLTLALYLAMLGRVTEGDAVTIAMPVRGREQPELENVMGFFNNVLPLAFEVKQGQRLGDFLQYVKRELLGVMGHQQVPFERLVAEPEFSARVKGGGLYQSLFSFQDTRERPRDLGGLQDRQMHLLQRGATDDLGVWLMEKAQGLEGAVVYNADIYRRDTAAAFRDRYIEVLRAAAAQPDGQLDDLTAPGDSTAAAHLQRLGKGSAEVKPAAAPAQPAASPGNVQPLLLPEQAQLAQLWASTLGIDVNDIRSTDNFFDLGGESMQAMRIVQQAEQVLGFRVEPRRYVFENLGQLATAELGTPLDPSAAPFGTERAPVKRGLLGRVLGWGRKN
ncbi:non-ribosomal peptide synthetase [Variovorax sp. dw_954]|uniref:non-ribosomal peptide synthetase n=1 Tax=Variovorax sp. dw_954 TaxID=2720078 RepID=UPI0021163959|nr:non-ribosomal peptide synthetase [Variovorax sp. dw_954]